MNSTFTRRIRQKHIAGIDLAFKLLLADRIGKALDIKRGGKPSGMAIARPSASQIP